MNGDHLRTLRQLAGVRQQDVADQLGVSRVAVSKAERSESLRATTMRRYRIGIELARELRQPLVAAGHP